MNHHRGYSATMANTVAPHHILPQHGQKTMTIAMTEHASEDGIACKPSELGPSSGSQPFGQENLLFV